MDTMFFSDRSHSPRPAFRICVSTTAFAANAYTPIKGGKFNFNKELTIKDGANVPNVTFGFTITPGESALSALSEQDIRALFS